MIFNQDNQFHFKKWFADGTYFWRILTILVEFLWIICWFINNHCNYWNSLSFQLGSEESTIDYDTQSDDEDDDADEVCGLSVCLSINYLSIKLAY